MNELRTTNEADELAKEARQLLLDLDRDVPGAAQATGECRPPLDVVDTDSAVEVVMDVPGVPASALRVCVRRDTVLVVGAKVAAPAARDARYHVAERSSGRFARAVRLSGTVDARRAKASVEAGLLRVVLPRIEDRRGRRVLIPVDTA